MRPLTLSPRAGRLTVWTLLAATTLVPKLARADDAACIAASEAEATLQKQVKYRDALKQLAICADPACPVDVKVECADRITRINAAMPTLVLTATDETGADLIAVEVSLDGAPFVTTLDGHSLAIDPGNHLLRFQAPGKESVEKPLVVREGEKDRHLAVVLAPTGFVVPVAATSSTPGAAPSPASSWSTAKTLALVTGGVGLVGIGLGAGFGLAASSDWSAAKNECSAGSCPSASRAHAQSDHDSATTAGNVSTGAFIVGAAGLVGGVVLWFTAPRSESHAAPKGAPDKDEAGTAFHFVPLVGTQSAGLMVVGSFQ
jgi:hypothetical protein